MSIVRQPTVASHSQWSPSFPRQMLYPIKITGMGSYVPPTVLTSAEMDQTVGAPAGWAKKSSGIDQRHVVTNESAIDLAVNAAREAIKAADIDKSEIDCIIATGALAHQPIPTSAVFIQRQLELQVSGITCFDVNATCLSFLAALDVAGGLLSAGRFKTVLVTAADVPSRGTSWANPELKAMFGDGAAAAIVQQSHLAGQGILSLRMETYSIGAKACQLRSGGTGSNPHVDYDAFLKGTWFEMDGPLAYRVSSKYMPKFMERLLGEAGISLSDITLVVPHQASPHALYLMRKKLGIPEDRLMDMLVSHGNQVSASVPTMLSKALASGRAKTGDIVLLIGTAAGITLGGAVVRL